MSTVDQPRRQRVEDEHGNVRCRDCHEFKPPDAMKWKPGQSKCTTICKRCFRRRYRSERSPEAQARRDARRAANPDDWSSGPERRAKSRALVRLAQKHPDEFSALFAAELELIHLDQLLGVQTVHEHLRRVYGRRGANVLGFDPPPLGSDP
jgi:hypothetical protein